MRTTFQALLRPLPHAHQLLEHRFPPRPVAADHHQPAGNDAVRRQFHTRPLRRRAGGGRVPAGGLNLNYNVGLGNGRGQVISRRGDFGDVNNNRAWLVNAFIKPNASVRPARRRLRLPRPGESAERAPRRASGSSPPISSGTRRRRSSSPNSPMSATNRSAQAPRPTARPSTRRSRTGCRGRRRR